MKKWVTAERFPLGAWPSTYNPSLMQQIGINICTSGEKDIFRLMDHREQEKQHY